MNRYNTKTRTKTFTVVDIRKVFEGFEADLRIIARRTKSISMLKVESYCHDITLLAEEGYLSQVDITLVNALNDSPIQATRYVINSNGTLQSGDRAGKNKWSYVENSYLTVIVSYNSKWKELTHKERTEFRSKNNFKINWSPSIIDTSYSHLSEEKAQNLASNGYELNKTNFK